VLNALAITAGVNLVLNAGIAWISLRGASSVPLWDVPLVGKTNTGLDTVGTFFFLPLMTTLFCTTAVWAELRAGRLRPFKTGALLDRLPPGRVRRGVVLGALCTAVLSPVAVLVFAVAGVGDMTATQFVLYKAVLCVALGALVTPIIALRAMGDEPSSR
jgi:hypothetical protein